jgi:hypothetical protein
MSLREALGRNETVHIGNENLTRLSAFKLICETLRMMSWAVKYSPTSSLDYRRVDIC